MAYISPEFANRHAGPEELGRLYEPLEFDQPRDFSISEILHLAPATDHTRVLICVSPLPSKNREPGQLRIWGLINTGSSWQVFSRGESQIKVLPPNCLTVSSDEPGNLSISREGTVLLNLVQGEIIAPSRQHLHQGPIAAFLSDAVDAIHSEVCSAIGEPQYDRNEQIDDYPQYFFVKFLERLLFEIRRKRHGGAVLMIPDRMKLDDPSITGRVRIKYPCHFNRAWPLIIRSLVLRHGYNILRKEIYTREGGMSPAMFHRISILDSQREEINRRISDSIELLASFSEVDGAVLITDKLRLLGFGAEITVSSTSLRNIHVAKDHLAERTAAVPIESYGTRHRSAFRFCWEGEESIAFAISQDGGIKSIRRMGDKLVCWPDIKFGPLGI